jgi:hypothetical protein
MASLEDMLKERAGAGMETPNRNQKPTDSKLRKCGDGFYVDDDRNVYFCVDEFLRENNLSTYYKKAFVEGFQEVFPDLIIVQE